MANINTIKLETLKQTKAFYIWELKKEGLTEKERASYLLALKTIKKIIKEKEDCEGRGRHKMEGGKDVHIPEEIHYL